MYFNGEGVKQNFTLALEYSNRSCELMNPLGCLGVGLIYYNGKGVRQNKVTSKEYFGRACDLGLQGGCDLYKSLNEQGF